MHVITSHQNLNLIQSKMKEQDFTDNNFSQPPPAIPVGAPVGEDQAVRPSIELPRVYADNSDKKRMIFHWAIFVAIMVLAMGLGSVLPNALQNLPANPSCPNPTDLDASKNYSVICSGPFDLVTNPTAGVIVTNLQPLNQFIVFSILLLFKEPANPQWNYSDSVIISLYALKNNQMAKQFQYKQNSTIITLINNKKGTLIYDTQNSSKLIGIDKSLIYLNAIDYQNYMFTVRFPQSNSQLQKIKDVKAYATVINIGYSQFGLALRYVFLILTTVSTVFFILRLRKIDRSVWVIEQKLVVALSIITIFFNDPFYAATISSPNQANNLFSVMWVVNLAVYLVLFWITILDRINNENETMQSKALTWKKAVYVVILWLSCFFYYLFYSYSYFMTSPLMTVQEFNKDGMIYLMMWVIVLFVGGFGYMIAQYIQIFLKLETKLWRNQLFVFFSIFFIIVTFFFFFINGFDIHSFIGGRVIILYVQLNTYLFYMQYMYSPTSEAIAKCNNQGGHTFQMAAYDVNTNIDEMRSVEINFPEEHYNKLGDDQEPDLGNRPKKLQQNREDVIELQ